MHQDGRDRRHEVHETESTSPDDIDRDILDCFESPQQPMVGYMKQYRQQKKHEAAQLKGTHAQLTNELQRLMERVAAKQRGMLSWKEVALALREDRDMTAAQSRQLKKQVLKYREMIQHMRLWVHSTTSPWHALDSRTPTWRNTTLVHHPESRRTGMDWMMQQMYFNMDRVMQANGFDDMSSRDLKCDCTFRYMEGRRVMVRRQEYIVDASLGQMNALINGNMLRWLNQSRMPIVPTEDLDDAPDGIFHSRSPDAHFLSREWVDDDRVVHVVLNVQDEGEAALPIHRFGMYVFKEIEPGKIKIRMLYGCADTMDVALEDLAKSDTLEVLRVPKVSWTSVYNYVDERAEALLNRRLRQEASISVARGKQQWENGLREFKY